MTHTINGLYVMLTEAEIRNSTDDSGMTLMADRLRQARLEIELNDQIKTTPTPRPVSREELTRHAEAVEKMKEGQDATQEDRATDRG